MHFRIHRRPAPGRLSTPASHANRLEHLKWQFPSITPCVQSYPRSNCLERSPDPVPMSTRNIDGLTFFTDICRDLFFAPSFTFATFFSISQSVNFPRPQSRSSGHCEVLTYHRDMPTMEQKPPRTSRLEVNTEERRLSNYPVLLANDPGIRKAQPGEPLGRAP